MVEQLFSQRIAVLRGGPSTEREISLQSGKAVIDVLSQKGFYVIDLILPDEKNLTLLEKWVKIKLAQEKPTVIFNALHGWFGEDGKIQSLLDKIGIPYTGSGARASELAMNKLASRCIFQSHAIAVPNYVIYRGKGKINLNGMHFPLLIKPISQGSSIGIHRVENEEQLFLKINDTLSYDGVALIEEFIAGEELTVSILEERALPVIKIIPNSGIYDYCAKYNSPLTRYVVPADIAPHVQSKAQELALKAHRALGCSGFSRVDMIYSPKMDRIFVLEVNTIPGLTPKSLLPKAAQSAGINFLELILRMLKSALVKSNYEEKEEKI